MKFSAVCLLALLAAALAQDATPSDVVILTDSNFAEKTSTGKWLLEFYAPWCGHCKKLAPTYETVATELKGKINVGKVDCTQEKAVCTAYGVSGYPTVKFQADNKLYDYSGDRSQADLVEFTSTKYATLTGNAVPSTAAAPKVAEGNKIPEPAANPDGVSHVVILTDENFDEQTSKGSWLLEFYAPWCGHCKNLAPTYEKVATALKGKVNVGKVDCTVNTGLSQRFGIRGYPTLKYLSNGELREFKGSRSYDDLVTYATEGYKTVTAAGIPAKPTGLEQAINQSLGSLKQVESFIKDKLWIAVAAVFVFGIIVGKFVFGGATYVVPVQPKKQN